MSVRPGEWRARLRLDPTAFVAPGAVVVGDVTLGARSSVWFNTVVRGDTARIEIGEETNLQDNTVVHVDEGQPALIGSRVTVGHRAIVHGCVVGDDCLVGMGSILLTGARIGAGSLIAAGSLVREGQQIPPGSLVMGAPAKVGGPLRASHREAVARGAAHYVELSRSYMARGFARPHAWPSSDRGITSFRPGPVGYLEWGQLLGTLAEGPDWVADRLEHHGDAAWRRRPGPDGWSALEALCHLRDADAEVYLPRVGRLLAEETPTFQDVDMRGWEVARRYAEESPADVLESWSASRRKLLGLLAPLSRTDWERHAFHSLRGPFPLAEMVRDWVDHDLAHRRQIAVALKEPA